MNPRVAAVGLFLALASAPLAAEPPPIFHEMAKEAGIDFEHFNGMSGELYFAEMTGAGVALFDYDNDGDLDAYLVQGTMLGDKPLTQARFQPAHPLPLGDRLYRNDLQVGTGGAPHLRFTDVTEKSGIKAHGYGMGVISGDYDNDGDVDLYVTNFGDNQLWRNDGDGTFVDATAKSGTQDGRWSVAAAFFDYDRDGWLDLYIGNYVDFRLVTHKACSSPSGSRNYCGPQAYPAEPDRLLRNRGDGTFEDVTEKAKVRGEAGAGLGAVTADFNGDGWPDLYVANDGTANHLWINQQDGTFLDEALLGGCAVNQEGQPEASMGIVAGDFNGDGSDDLFMAHLTRETNTLYLNDGRGFFSDASQPSGLGAPSWAFTGFGTLAFDYDNDGHLDLYVANGAVKLLEDQLRDGDPHPLRQTDQLFRNRGKARFEDATAQGGAVFTQAAVGRGVAAGDVDNDGDTDLLLSNNAGAAWLLRNQVGQDQPWLGLRLVAGTPPRDQLGARVALMREGAPTLWRQVRTDGSYASARDPRLLFGLGDGDRKDGTAVRAVEVHWPEGHVETFPAPATGRYTTLQQGTGTAGTTDKTATTP